MIEVWSCLLEGKRSEVRYVVKDEEEVLGIMDIKKVI